MKKQVLKFEKKRKLIGGQGGCMHCPGNETILDMETRLYQSMGGYMVTKNGKLNFMEDSNKEFDECKQLKDIEKKARHQPNNDWRVILDLVLRGAVYQRQRGKWYLIETNLGFA